jgi:hypothetical protein
MLALAYLAAMIYFGDRVCRYFYRFVSVPHRLATSFLTGLLLSALVTYLGSLAFARFTQPMLMGNLLFLAVLALVVYKLPRHPSADYLNADSERPAGSARWDWMCLGALFLFACWLMFATLNFKEGKFLIGFKSWTDFGANISLVQSFVFGHNFPTMHPFFPGEPIRYHFLFWFQAANLEFLGLNPAWGINLLSILSLMALLILIMTFAEVLFNSRVVGRISALLFLFSSSLYYLPFLRSQESVGGLVSAIRHRTEFLPSGYPWRGEDWGVLTISVLGNQRHLISGIAIFFVVLIFLVDRYRAKLKEVANAAPQGAEPVSEHNAALNARGDGEKTSPEAALLNEDASDAVAEGAGTAALEAQAKTNKELDNCSPEKEGATAEKEAQHYEGWDSTTPPESGDTTAEKIDKRPADKLPPTKIDRPLLWASIFSGALIGLLPFWNSPVFVASLAVLGCLLLLFPHRVYLASLLGTTGLLGLPQVLLLRARTFDQPIFHWGYTLDNPSLWQVLKYLGWAFGLKWVLILVALIFLSKAHRKLFLALSSLIVVVFLFQLSTDTFNNHKLLNIWAVFASIYAAYGLWRIGKTHAVGIAFACVLAVATIFGGVVDLFPIHNDPALTVPYQNDRLTAWLFENTKPSDVFLSQTLLTHPILFTGRKIFLGNTLFAWTAGYRVGEREAIYRRMFQERDPVVLIRLLNQNGIAYVAIDSGVRSNNMIKGLNESVYQQHFQKVFDDTDRLYDFVTIYKVPSLEQAK